jgi:hypothetical protein
MSTIATIDQKGNKRKKRKERIPPGAILSAEKDAVSIGWTLVLST